MNRHRHVREDRPDDEIDLVALKKALDLRDGHVGLEFVVDDDHLDVAPAELAAEILHRELEAVARLLAEHGRRSREGQEQADLQLLLRQGRRGSKAKAAARPKGLDRHDSSWSPECDCSPRTVDRAARLFSDATRAATRWSALM